MKNRYHSFFPKLVQWAILSLLITVVSVPRVSLGQYDVLSQPPRQTAPLPVETSAINNYGMFVLGATNNVVSLLGNSGNVIASSSSPFTSTANNGGLNPLNPNLALAANHHSLNSESPRVIVARFIRDDNNTALGFYRYQEGAGLSISGNIMTMDPANESVFAQTPLTLCGANGGGYGGLEAAMDQRFLYLAWLQCTDQNNSSREVWFAVFDFSINDWATLPRRILSPMGGFARSFARPTVSCNRWNDGSDPNSAQIAFTFLNGGANNSCSPAFMRPNPAATQNVSIALLEPNLGAGRNCLWVRVQEFDERDAGLDFHYFYCYDGGAAGGPDLLYSTDNATVSAQISDRIIDNGFRHVPCPSAAYGYSASDDHSVYLAFRETTQNPLMPNEMDARICRQFGADNQSAEIAQNISHWSIGCNQMGILYPVQNGIATLWRSLKPFRARVTENTLASGLCHLTQATDGPLPSINIGDAARRNFTFRIFGTDGLPRIQSFSYISNGPLPPALHAGMSFGNPQVNDGTRALLLLDGGATIDFNGILGSRMIASSDGRMDYNGSSFINGNASVVGVEGNLDHPDTVLVRRGQMFVNSAGTWPSIILWGRKGEITFAPASTQANMRTITLTGQNAGVDLDVTNVYLGSEHPTQGLTQIELIGSTTVNENQLLSITNSHLNTRFQEVGWTNNSSTPEVGRPLGSSILGGWRSDIVATRPSNVKVSKNRTQYIKFDITNPITDVLIHNNIAYIIRDFCDIKWAVADNSVYSGKVEVSYNIVHRNWPFEGGNVMDAGTVFRIHGFNVPNQFDVTFDNNKLFERWWEFNPNLTGLHLAFGTHASVTENIIQQQGIGVFEEVVGAGNTFYCANWIMAADACPSIQGIGLKQVGDAGTSFVKKNIFLKRAIGFFGGDFNRSTMIRNDFKGGDIGAHIENQASTIFTGSHTGGDDYAAFNLFSENRELNVSLSGSMTSSVQPEFGAPLSKLPGEIGTWGQNIFEDYNPNGYNNKNMKFKEMGSGVFNTTLFVPISGNHWQPAAYIGNSNNQWLIGSSQDPEFIKIAHRNKENGSVERGDYFCGGGASPLSKGASITSASFLEDAEDSLYLYEAALLWDGRDNRKALDTMRLYCELHPFATEYPGRIYTAIRYTHIFTGKITDTDVQKWKDQYRWLEMMQPRNADRNYQIEVLANMCAALVAYDRNGAANLWYNLTLLYEELYDLGWRQIGNIREHQGFIGEDTTAFYIIDKFKPVAAVALSKHGDLTDVVVRSVVSSQQLLTLLVDVKMAQDLAIEVYDLVGVRLAAAEMDDQYAGAHRYEVPVNFTGPAFVILRTHAGSQTLPIVIR